MQTWSLLGKISKKFSIHLPVVEQVLLHLVLVGRSCQGLRAEPQLDFLMLAASQVCTCTFPFFPTRSGRGNPAWPAQH